VRQKLILAALFVGGIILLDVRSKQWALEALAHKGTVESQWGLPLTLAFNQGIAFGLDIPSAGRWILIAASVFVVLMLGGMFQTARPGDWVRLSSLSLVGAGAVGNLIDRVRWDRGVVDFIGPINLGFMNWPIFNVADMAITIGAVLLAWSMWREGARAKTPALESTNRAAASDTGD
jgi:signal peptidase II